MATQVQFRRGTTAETASFTGASGEITVDLTKHVCVVHDAIQVGGYPLMLESGVNSALSLGTLSNCSLKFLNDPNTGFFSPGPDQLTLVTGGVARITIDSAGAVSIPGNFNIIGDFVTGNLTIADKIIHAGDTDTAIRFPEADTVTVETSGAERVRVSSGGLVSLESNAGLSISSTDVTTPVTANGNVFSGTYTPTLTNVDNVTISTATVCHYMRVGNVVTVGGQLSMTATAANTDTQVRITLPVASTFSNARQLGGSGGALNSGEYGESVVLGADTTNNIAFLRGRPTVTTNQQYNFSFTYLVS